MLCIFAALAVSSARAQAVLYVQPGATGDCTSWAAACGLQDALAAAAAGDEIWVAEGTYTPTDGTDRGASFELVNGVALYGGFAGTETARDQRDWRAHETTLSGNLVPGDASNRSYHVVYAENVDATTLLDGFDIVRGRANGGGTDNLGGGFYCNGRGAGNFCNPTIQNVRFRFNRGSSGAAIYNDGSNGGVSSPTIRNVVMIDNVANNGGAIYNGGSGGGESSPTIVGAHIVRNEARVAGGAIYNDGSNGGVSSPAITNVTFSINVSANTGAIYNDASGGGTSSPAITNVILWANIGGGEIYNDAATPVVRYTLIQGGCAGISENSGSSTDCGDGSTILDADPLFADFRIGDNGTRDFRLTGYSPALNAGTPDTTGLGLPPVDRLGNPRVFQNDVPALRVVDLGAYEFQNEPLDYVCPPGAALYVDQDAAGANNGTSWTDAFTRLQDGLALARSGNCAGVSEVWVAEGIYRGSFVLRRGMALYGGFAGTEVQRDERDWRAHETILSGDVGTPGDSTDNSRHVIYARQVGPTTVLDGFTVTGGYNPPSPTPPDVHKERGGGFLCYGQGVFHCDPTIRNVIFRDNYAGVGGAFASFASNNGRSSPTFINVSFINNHAEFRGGALGNHSDNGGISNPVLTNVLFAGNRAEEGGAIYNLGVRNGENNPTLTNVTFVGNRAENAGGAIYNNASTPVLTNVILWGNDAANSGDQIANQNASTPVVRHTLVEGGCAADWDCGDGSTILTADPLFADPANGDYRLRGSGTPSGLSPAIDAGTPDTTGLNLPPVDLAGEARVTAVVGTEAVIDLGAYESNGAPLPVELTAFTASVEGQAVVLSWKTLSEKGSARFVIERATSAVEMRDLASLQWQTVASVDAAGTTTEAQSYTYRVEDLDYGTYTFRLRQEDLDGTTETLGEVEAVVGLTEAYMISKVYPNPSSGRATLEVAVREAQHVRVEVYDVLGRRVATLFDGEVAASDTRLVRLDGSRLSSGVYFVRVVGEDFAEMRRVTLVR